MVQGTDDANVCMILVQLHARGFQSFECNQEWALGLNVEFLAKCIRWTDEKSSVEILCEVGGEHDDEIELIFRSPDNNSSESSYKLLLLPITNHNIYDITTFSSVATFCIPSSELRRICNSLSPFGKTLVIFCMPDEIRFSVMGHVGVGSITIRKPRAPVLDEHNSVMIDCTMEVTQNLHVPYVWHIITQSMCLSENVIVTVTSEGPVIFEFKMGVLGYTRYYLAPVIDDI